MTDMTGTDIPEAAPDKLQANMLLEEMYRRYTVGLAGHGLHGCTKRPSRHKKRLALLQVLWS